LLYEKKIHSLLPEHKKYTYVIFLLFEPKNLVSIERSDKIFTLSLATVSQRLISSYNVDSVKYNRPFSLRFT